MNKNVLIIMAGAAVVAIVVAIIVQSSISPKPTDGPSKIPSIEVLVANRVLLKGEVVKPVDVSWKHFPEGGVFKGVIKRESYAKDETKLPVYNKPLRRDIEAGEPITTQSVIIDVKGSGSFLSVNLEPGMRAVGVAVKAETTAGGFVSPGDRVDVILTYQVSIKGEAARYAQDEVQRFASETILTNVRVLAVDQNAKESSHDAKVARTVTLEVDRDGVQVLAIASSMGSISLALRRLGEKDSEEDKNIPLTTDVNASQTMKKIYKAMGRSQIDSGAVRVYSGADAVNVPVNSAKGP